MPKVTIRVSEETYQRLHRQAEMEHTTVTAILTEAAERDPRLALASARFAESWNRYADECADLSPEEAPAGRLGGQPHGSRAA